MRYQIGQGPTGLHFCTVANTIKNSIKNEIKRAEVHQENIAQFRNKIIVDEQQPQQQHKKKKKTEKEKKSLKKCVKWKTHAYLEC